MRPHTCGAAVRTREEDGTLSLSSTKQMDAIGGKPPLLSPKVPNYIVSISRDVLVFLGWGQHPSALLLLLLLLMAGIERNPGPNIKFPCTVCKLPARSGSILCTTCDKWTHSLKKCSGIKINQYIYGIYKCPPCQQATKTAPKPSIPPKPSLNRQSFNIMQFNCNSLKLHSVEIGVFLHESDIHIAAFQETKLGADIADPVFPGYTLVRRDRNPQGGGLAFVIKNTLSYVTLDLGPSDGVLEAQAITVQLTNQNINIVNLYIPPHSSCPDGYKASIVGFLNLADALIVGDINAHDELWHSSKSDKRGEDLSGEIDLSTFITLNTDSQTRNPSAGAPTSPDVSLASQTLAMDVEWNTVTALSSDHLPIIINLGGDAPPVPSVRTTFININKADWPRFQAESETLFSDLPLAECPQRGEAAFRRIVAKASKHSIPAGRIKFKTPTLPSTAKAIVVKRDALRATNPLDPAISTMNKEISKLIVEERRTKWRSFIESLDRFVDCTKLWKMIKKLSNREKPEDMCGITFNTDPIMKPREQANKFNKQFTSPRPHASNKLSRRLIRDIKKRPLQKTTAMFSEHLVQNCIKKAKNSKAYGPDDMTTIHLKHLGPHGIRHLTHLFNISVSSCRIPAIWKNSTIIPLLKPGKKPVEAKSYRPISLLCPSVKILEALLLPYLKTHLSPAAHQHGFRSLHSTTTALTTITNHVAAGFNQQQPPSRTVLTALDLSKAFDCVDHYQLLLKIHNSTLPGHLVRWMSCYLRGRQATTRFRNTSSKKRIVHCGVPQGSVISPCLFNFYLADLPLPPNDIKLTSYADDVTVYSSGPKITPIVNRLNKYLPKLKEFFSSRLLEISATKSTVTLLTPSTKEANLHPKVKLDGQVIPLVRNPKILGLTFDPMFTFSKHCRDTATKARQRNPPLKAMAGTEWGQDKETLIMTYNATGRSILNYADPAWTPIVKKSNFRRLQVIQNAALRVATGCLRMASEDHLHQECNILPVKAHCDLLTHQFAAACRFTQHPCHHILLEPAPPRRMKESLRTYCTTKIDQVLHTTGPDPTPRSIQKQLHTQFVTTSIAQMENNRVTGSKPLKIAKEELELPRRTRTALSQLRSGFNWDLNSYKARLDPAVLNVCPKCNEAPHDTAHLFTCTKNQRADVSVLDLWRGPKKASEYLGLDTE